MLRHLRPPISTPTSTDLLDPEMSNLSQERARQLAQQMHNAALHTTGREMHVCVNSGELADLMEHFSRTQVPGAQVMCKRQPPEETNR